MDHSPQPLGLVACICLDFQVRHCVIAIRGRFATQELLVLDLDIMVRLDINTKE